MINLTRQRFNSLFVLAQSPRKDKRGHSFWEVLCDCGNRKVVRIDALRLGQSSCGCLRGEQLRTHGAHGTPEYRSYRSAMNRCTNPRSPSYPEYGGRGIRFMFSSFQEFRDHIGQRPRGYSLDRINNDGNYEPGNVRWASRKTQANNRRPRRRTKTSQSVRVRRGAYDALVGARVSAPEFATGTDR